ncbi:MAG: hypothetical protein U0872_12945 [Planctomycetaceae bacterium]
MTAIPDHNDWMSIDRTFLPPLPRRSKLTVQEVTPDRFFVTYLVSANGLSCLLLVLSFLPNGIMSVVIGGLLEMQYGIPLWITGPTLLLGISWLLGRGLVGLFRRPEGGKLLLDREQLRAEGGAVFRWSETHPIDHHSRLDVVDIGNNESTSWALSLQVDQKWKTLASEIHLSVADQKWLCRHMNSWLGWEFPSHCVACGRLLDSQDVDWRQRSVKCAACDFAGPAPDPFVLDAVPPAPPVVCPGCTGTIWLTDVNRETGGYRCHRCHWSSEALPPMRIDSFADAKDYWMTALGRAVPIALTVSDKFLSNDELQQEFPSASSARRQLEDDRLIDDGSRDKLTLAFGNWQVPRFKWLVFASVLMLILNLWLLFWVFPGTPPRTWLHWYGRMSSFMMLPVFVSLAAFIAWWGGKRVRMIFTPEALLLQIGQIKRIIRWNTLKDVATHKGVWPPMVYLVYGGTGALVTPPSHATARAITRLCQIQRDEASRYATMNSGLSATDPNRIGIPQTETDVTNSA